jgi:dimethylglycine dehydrogenase
MSEWPTHARVVVIGGGAVGCSALYHLAQRGWSDCVLLEMDELTSGSTWHAAGNCPNFSGSWGIMKLQRYSTQLYARLAAETGYPINYHVTGAVRLAQTAARMDEYRHVTAMARHQGIAFEMLSPSEIRARHPFVETRGLAGGQWDPFDGDIDPAQLTQALAHGARAAGARILRACRVTAIAAASGGAWRVSTTRGDIVAEIVVNAAGYRAAEIGAMVGRTLPCVAMSHQYLVTADIAALEARSGKLPLLRDPDDSYYLRQEGRGLLLGPYEWKATAHWPDGVPESFAFQLFPDDLERLEPQIELAIGRVPILGSVGIKKVINGPIPYTPDGNPLIGPAPGLRNVYEACVFSFGIVQAGGAGKTLADWVIDGEPEWDLWSLDPRRYTGHVTPAYTRAKAIELYQREYAISFPFEERPAGRPAKLSPLHGRLAARGALFGARNGWERAIWFPRDANEATLQDRLTLARPDFTPAIARECRAVAEAVGLIELPGFSRFRVSGPGAAAALDRLIAGRLPALGRISLAYVLSRRGGVLAEFTITRLAPDSFWLLSASSGEWHDRDLLAAHVAGPGVSIVNETADHTTLVLAGPRSRALLQGLTATDLSTASFPWLQARSIDVAGRRVEALRVNYVGELGWELHAPMADAPAIHDALRAAGTELGLADVGIYAVESLRLEKGYRSWKQDLTTEYSAAAAGLDRFVRLDKPEFPGRDAALRERDAGGPADRLVPLLVDAEEADAPVTASVLHAGAPVGIVTSGGFGHRIGRSIALAYLRADLAAPGTRVEIPIYGRNRQAVVTTEPLYDPNNARLKA